MRNSGKITAAIEVLEDFAARRVPLKVCLADWGRAHRFAGAKDRAWISGLCLDVLRHYESLAFQMGDQSIRARTIGCLGLVWKWQISEIQVACAEEPHGAGALTATENAALAAPKPLSEAPLTTKANIPEWLGASVERAFGDAAIVELQSFTARASVDLRVNTIKADPAKALKSVSTIGAIVTEFLPTALRVPAPAPSERAAAVETIPAYAKGWVEVQDLGSQIVAGAAGEVKGQQVLDFCAGGGGKTLALSAMMKNTGQIFAYDNDARRLVPIFDRLKRAGARNVQVRSPADGGKLDDLIGKMDVVFIDAPCTGTGTWRRRPDTKWRLTQEQLAVRQEEQKAVLDSAQQYLKPGGRLIYVTCSFLAEENEDSLAEFLKSYTEYQIIDSLEEVAKSGLLSSDGLQKLAECITPEGALRLSPLRTGTDGFFVAVLQKK